MQMNRCSNCMEETEKYPCSHCGYTPSQKNQNIYALKANTILNGRYLVGRPIGQGGFGITYVGLDLAQETKVAIKEYFPSGQVTRTLEQGTVLLWNQTVQAQGLRKDGMESFLREARKMARVDQIPNVVHVRDLFQENETAYIVMDYAEGETLKNELLQNGVMSWEKAKNVFRPVLETLVQVHNAGIIHRDLSPDNLMISPDGSVQILDLGAAKDLNTNSGASSMQVAKSGFSPLEQYTQRGSSGPWSDVYAMAATIYYTLTGTLPPSAFDRIDEDPIQWNLPELKKVPEGFLVVLKKAMSVQAKNRCQSAQELLDALNADSPADEREQQYQHAKSVMAKSVSENDWLTAARLFDDLKNYQDSHALAEQCRSEAEKNKLPVEEPEKKPLPESKAEETKVNGQPHSEHRTDAKTTGEDAMTIPTAPPKRNIAAILLIAVLLIGIGAGAYFWMQGSSNSVDDSSSSQLADEAYLIRSMPNKSSGFDVVTFGHYDQDGNPDNGEEPIEWLVLERTGNRMLLLSRRGIEAKPYHDTLAEVCWENCSLRTWLNREFLNSAFTEAERQIISLTDVDNSRSQGYSEWKADSGNNTKDRAFLLSYAEADRYLSIAADGGEKHASRMAITEHAKKAGGNPFPNVLSDDRYPTGWWWLRTSGVNQYQAGYVKHDGYGSSCRANLGTGCIRPAIWVEEQANSSAAKTEETSAKEAKPIMLDTPVLTGASVSEESVTVTWQPVAGAEKYRVFQKTDDGKWTKVQDTAAVECTVNVPTAGQKYIFTVRCITADGKQYTSDYDHAGITAEQTIKPGDIVTFGRYEQDNNWDNGPETIEWIVLESEGGWELLMSRYILDIQPYNTWGKAGWDGSSVRKWLNESFYYIAFSEDEKRCISNTTQETKNSEATTDKVFLLSQAQANQYGFLLAEPTILVKNKWNFNYSEETYWWWLLRDTSDSDVALVYMDKEISFEPWMNATDGGVRPVIWHVNG